jgi:hypothetical protein
LLKGKHLLSGVEEDVDNKDCQRLLIKLDGDVYQFIEDDNDGYRSAMDDENSKIINYKMKNTFNDIEVFIIYVDESNGYDADIIRIYNIDNGELIIEVGTDNIDDYYPSFICNYNAENLGIL